MSTCCTQIIMYISEHGTHKKNEPNESNLSLGNEPNSLILNERKHICFLGFFLFFVFFNLIFRSPVSPKAN